MSEAPKKIWVDDDVLWGSALEFQSDYKKETAYIRADIVDELVEALKICLAGNGYEFDDRPAEAALKKLDES
jgi:hypothetical protein